MKETSLETCKRLLLRGEHINKFNLMTESEVASVCLAQRIYDLRNEGWKISSQSIKGKGNLNEYWLEPDEIKRLTTPIQEKIAGVYW